MHVHAFYGTPNILPFSAKWPLAGLLQGGQKIGVYNPKVPKSASGLITGPTSRMM